MKHSYPGRTAFLTVLTFAVLSLFVSAQGPLDPPGPPWPSMKTLDQVEPRTPVDDLHTPGDPSTAHIISKSGSYYLTGPLELIKDIGIEVRAADVTLDLNGFTISRITGNVGVGIKVSYMGQRCVIQNGFIDGDPHGQGASFQFGVLCLPGGGQDDIAQGGTIREVVVSKCYSTGIEVGDGWRIDRCIARDNSGKGIWAQPGSTILHSSATYNGKGGIHAGDGSVVIGCSSDHNSSEYGIESGSGSTLENCSATHNTGLYGIYVGAGSQARGCNAFTNQVTYAIGAGEGSTLQDCSAAFNGATYGIHASDASTLHNCSSINNDGPGAVSYGIYGESSVSVIGCVARLNGRVVGDPTLAYGIYGRTACTIRDCVANNNSGGGIRVKDKCFVIENSCFANGEIGVTTNSAGIFMELGGDNVIDANYVARNDLGIVATSFSWGNIITRNYAGYNGPAGGNFILDSGNRYGPIVHQTGATPAVTVTDLGAASTLGTTDTWANISLNNTPP